VVVAVDVVAVDVVAVEMLVVVAEGATEARRCAVAAAPPRTAAPISNPIIAS
jgi:hypothetical protein